MEVITASSFQHKPQKQRQRRNKPCDACRKSKTRCVVKEGATECLHCQARNSTCEFQQEPPRRTVRERNDGAQSTIQTAGSHHDAQIARARTSPRTTSVTTQSPSQRTIEDISRAPVPQSDSLVQTDPNTILGLAVGRFSELYGLGSDMEPILMRHRPYDPNSQEYRMETHSIRRVMDRDSGLVDYPVTFHFVSDSKAIDYDLRPSQATDIEECVRPHGRQLVELFWRYVQPSYPLLHKASFVERYDKSYSAISPGLLGAVYLSALRWWSYDPELSTYAVPDSTKLRKLLKQAIDSSYHRPKLSSVQAMLLLLQCQPEDALNPDHTYVWSLTCQTLAVGQCLGLHLDASGWSIPDWEKNIRKRLGWALFMQDRWSALAYGRPVHIHTDDWVVHKLTRGDFTDCYNSSTDDERWSITTKGETQFTQMVELTLILSEVLSALYTARTAFDQDTVVLYQRVQPLLERLNAWYRDLPTALSLDIVYQRKLNFHGSLHLSYYGVVMALLRRLIRSTALAPRCMDDSVIAAIRQLGLQTSQSAIDVVANLRHDQMEAFWYFTSPYLFSLIGSFTTLLLITSLSSQERDFWQDTLNSYLWKLRIMSKGSEPIRYAVNRLEGAILRGLEHALAVNINEPLDHDTSPAVMNFPPPAYDFGDFGDWDLAANDGAFDLLSGMNFEPGSML